MNFNVSFSPDSTLGAMTIIGLITWIGGKTTAAVLPSIGSEVAGIGQLVFFLGLFVWLLFIIPTLIRNWSSL